MKAEENENNYVIWQNRAFHFYLAARLLCLNQHIVTADFCAQQSMELLLKATLLYHDKSFVPEAVGHRFNRMLNTLKNKVKNSGAVNIPEYFYYDDQYRSFTRYPSDKEGLFQPDNLLDDLDKCFYDLLVLVAYQRDTLLVKTLSNHEKLRKKLKTLSHRNQQIRNIRNYLKKCDQTIKTI
jgi:HEPN domain-containing protein